MAFCDVVCHQWRGWADTICHHCLYYYRQKCPKWMDLPWHDSSSASRDRNAHFVKKDCLRRFLRCQICHRTAGGRLFAERDDDHQELTGILFRNTASMPESSVFRDTFQFSSLIEKVTTDDSTIAEVWVSFSLEEMIPSMACVRIAGSKNPVINESFHSLCQKFTGWKEVGIYRVRRWQLFLHPPDIFTGSAIRHGPFERYDQTIWAAAVLRCLASC